MGGGVRAAPEQVADLLDLLEDVQTVHTRWRRRLRGGHAAIQEDIDRRTQAAKRIRNAEIAMIPGLLQTAGYARGIITAVSAAYGTTDIDATVQARIQRQGVLYDQSKTSSSSSSPRPRCGSCRAHLR